MLIIDNEGDEEMFTLAEVICWTLENSDNAF